MKTAWDKTTASLEEFQAMLQNFINTAALPNSEQKRLHEINKKWQSVLTAVNNFDKFVAPVDPVEIKLPETGSADFYEVWQYWKDYLAEQHGVYMRSRAEVKALERLFEIADNNTDDAIYFLNSAMSYRWKNVFKIDRKEAAKPVAINRDSDKF